MITSAAVEHFKEIAPMLVNLIPGGAIFGTTDLEAYTWKLASDVFDMPAFEVGKKFSAEGLRRRPLKPSGSLPGYWMMARVDGCW